MNPLPNILKQVVKYFLLFIVLGIGISALGISSKVYAAQTWTQMSSGTTKNLYGVWAYDATHVWAVGQDGTILFYNGTSWATQTSGTTYQLTSVSGVDTTHVWAAGCQTITSNVCSGNGVILKFNGTSWSTSATITNTPLYSISALTTTAVWAGGKTSLGRQYATKFNGTSWSAMSFGSLYSSDPVYAIIATPTVIYALGNPSKVFFAAPSSGAFSLGSLTFPASDYVYAADQGLNPGEAMAGFNANAQGDHINFHTDATSGGTSFQEDTKTAMNIPGNGVSVVNGTVCFAGAGIVTTPVSRIVCNSNPNNPDYLTYQKTLVGSTSYFRSIDMVSSTVGFVVGDGGGIYQAVTVSDNTPPSVTDVTGTGAYKPGDTITISGTISDTENDVGMVRVKFTANNSDWGNIDWSGVGDYWKDCSVQNAYTAQSSTFTCTIDSTSALWGNMPLPNGAYTVTLRAYDSVGNWSDIGEPEVDLDALPPAITTLTIPSPSSARPVITGSVTDLYATVANVQYQLDGTSGTWNNCTPDDGAYNSQTESFTCSISTDLSGGMHTVYINATDSVGNTTIQGNPPFDSMYYVLDLSFNANREIYVTSPQVTFKINNADQLIANLTIDGYPPKVKISEDPTFTGVSLTDIAVDNPFTLSSRNGTHTVYTQFWYWDGDEYYLQTTESAFVVLTTPFLVDTTPPTGTISINNGAIGTASTSVTLTLSATDTESGVSQMEVSEDSSFTGASFESYATSKSFTLSSGEGTKTVYVRYKDTVGNISSSYADTIIYDNTPPATNASSIVLKRSPTGVTVAENGWVSPSPYFSWTDGSDGTNGSGIKGYCLYIGSDPSGDPEYTKGLLGTSPVDITGTPCQFIVSTPSIDLSTPSYQGSTWLTTSSSPYYINIKALDNVDLLYQGSSVGFAFKYDGTKPKNVNYITSPGSTFSNISDMFFSWPTSGSVSSNDTDGNNSGVYGWQYQLNGTSGTWHGSIHSDLLGVDYIPLTDSTYQLTDSQDGGSVVSGNNTVYFRTLDLAGNASSDATIRTGNLKLGGLAPRFGGSDSVTVSPSTSNTNSYALSWPAATPDTGRSITHYYYSVNTLPPTTLDTLQSNHATYIDNGTSRTVTSSVLPGANRGTNHVYVTAIDDGSPVNYSSSNYITGTFTLDSTNPDNVGSLVASDSSIKASSSWNVTLTWTEPVYKGAGNLIYEVFRSEDNDIFTQVGTTQGLSYVDNTPSSRLYYYKVVTKDGANAESSGTNTVSITPTGRWTTAPDLVTGPTVSGITARKATISWTTSRSADTKVQYGTKHNTYGSVEPSLFDQTSAHSIQVSGLMPNTTYYYKAKWTDEDGNTASSDEHTFKTASPPIVKSLGISNLNISTATVKFSSKGASSVKIYYGPTTSFGGIATQAVSTQESTYSVPLTKLSDGTKYYYRINAVDSDGFEYQGTIYDFTTPPKPTITNIDIQELVDTALTTVQVNWDSNTGITSVLSIHPVGSKNIRTESETKRIAGTHTYKVSNLKPQTQYSLRITGTDAKGNTVVSDEYIFTTSTDSRPPDISNLSIETVILPTTAGVTKQAVAQIIVSWNTDELSTSQVAFGEGSSAVYGQTTPEDVNLTYNHSVVISDLQPAKVYHLRVLSKDAAGNEAKSVDTTAITPKATEDALSLVIQSLSETFKFLRQ